MGKELQKLRARKEVRQRLDAINDRRDMCLVIHYSCESFYDIKDGRTPRVTSIAIREFASGQTTSFSIHKNAELNGVPQADITAKYDELEKEMLAEFYAFLKTKPDHTFIHWNMRDITTASRRSSTDTECSGASQLLSRTARRSTWHANLWRFSG